MCNKIGRGVKENEWVVLSPSLPGMESDGSDYEPFIGKDGKIYKQCDQCNKEKLYEEFPDNNNSQMPSLRIFDENGDTGDVNKKRKTCNECRKPSGNKDSMEAERVWKKYNIPDPTEKTCCEICEKTYEENGNKKMVRDHCHERDIPRGPLCNQCNTGLGQLKDNLETLRKAVKYLESVEGENWKKKFNIQESTLM